MTYFQPDSKKNGGAYVTVRGRVKKIDVCSCRMVFTDQTAIALETICAMEGELFGSVEDFGI